MPRQAAIQAENNFRGGLITEASGLNFPENACTDTLNCVFSFDGSVQRRLGFEYEVAFTEKSVDRTNSVVTSYIWRNVTGNGDVTLFVMQVGATLYFYTTTGASISDGALSTTVDLSVHKAAGAPSVATKEAQFADGNGFLFVAHPFCTPLRLEYDTVTRAVSATEVELTIRDFEGVDDGWELDERDRSQAAGTTNIDAAHLYNLLNQGWTKKTLNLKTFNKFVPSNTDVMYLFKNAKGKYQIGDGDFDVDPDSIQRGNSPAPKGHFILTMWDQDRRTAVREAEDTNVGINFPESFNTDTGYQRPSTCCFFAGRAFWAGLNHPDFNSKIYFSQIVERDEQYGQCYQQNDPTAEDAFDLLPADGGVISIPEAGTIYKLFAITGGVAVFAANGIWVVLGSTGIGFTAKDYTVTKLTAVNAISASSFVDVAGNPAWWNREGIYLLTSDGSAPKIQSLTDQRIKKFFDTIPLTSKLNAKGFFSLGDSTIQWVYRTTATSDATESYSFDGVLNFNLLTSAFYPWAIDPDAGISLHTICVFDGSAGTTVFEDVLSNDGTVVQDDDGEDVETFRFRAVAIGQTFKYLISREDEEGNFTFSFAECKNVDYVDWASVESTDYTSYFISGYKLHGQAIKKFQANYVRFFSRNDVPTKYRVQGIWDFANTPSGTSRWSVKQLVQHSNTRFDDMSKRLKIRGHGLALQLRVESVTGEPFDLLGWSMFESGNQGP